MPVISELHFSPEVKPYKISKKHNPPNFAEQALRLFRDLNCEPSLEPLLDVFKRIKAGGVSIAPIVTDQLRTSEFLLAPAQNVSTLKQGDSLAVVRVVYRPMETNSYAVEGMLPSRRAQETGASPDPLRPTLELFLVKATVQPDGTVVYEEPEVPTIQIVREYHQPRRLYFDNDYTIIIQDQRGESKTIIDGSLSSKMEEDSRQVMWLIASVGQMLHRHEELQLALARGESGLSDKTGVELMQEQNQQLIAALQATTTLDQGQSTVLVPAQDPLTGLTQREQDVMRLRFGIGVEGGVTKTQAKVARELGISSTRVKQLEIAALAKLRRKTRLLKTLNEPKISEK